ncbi:ABC transporter substrate-binding protein [Paenibacillus chungangensis]|uniref:ABC transporter substrate-binding protein n=1 Tax=Paenibacillus chungangensis TaxID=696535 RepID=A0ABW3HVD6_9BACL
MSSKTQKMLSTVLVAILLAVTVIGCSSGNGNSSRNNNSANQGNSGKSEATATPEEKKEIVTIKSIYPGDKPAGTDAVLAKVNEKMAADIGVKLELTFAPWDQYANKITLDAATSNSIDFFWNGSSQLVNYYSQKLLAPIDELMEQHGQAIYENIDSMLFEGMKMDGKLYGIPSTGNSPKANIYQSILYRDDLRMKHNLPVPDSVENFEAFLQGIKDNEPDLVPLTSASVAYILMNQFGPEEYLAGTGSSAGFKINEDGTITVMPTQEMTGLREAAKLVHEWYKKGFIPEDILNIGDVTARLTAGATAVVNGAAMSAADQQNVIANNVKDAVLNNQGFGPEKKYIRSPGGDAIYVTSQTKKGEAVIKFVNWVFSSQENYDLYVYGIEGVNYEIIDERVKMLNEDYVTFPGWMFKNMNLQRFAVGITDDYIEKIKKWDEGAEFSPLMGFNFNPESVKTELAQAQQVFNAYSSTLNSGIVDPETIWPEFTKQMKAAGQDKIIEEAQKQIDEFLASK